MLQPTPSVETFVTRFEAQARDHAGDLAACDEATRLTYDELNRAANRLARGIVRDFGAVSEPVALMFGQNVKWVVAVLGVLKAGKFAVPLDSVWGEAQRRSVLNDSGARLWLTDVVGLALPEADIAVRSIEDMSSGMPDGDLGLDIPLDALARLIYTSGTTGAPKGAMQTHRLMLMSGTYSSPFSIGRPDRFCVITSFAFNITLRTVAQILLTGASLWLFDARERGLRALADWIRDHALTTVYVVPSVLRQLMLSLGEDERLESLRLVRCGGEALHARDVELFRRHTRPGAVLSYTYGSAEGGIIASTAIDHHTPITDDPIPVGVPPTGVTVSIVGEDGSAVAPGEIGEIVVTSARVTPGYWRGRAAPRADSEPAGGDASSRVWPTGDVGRWLPGGALQLLGRKDAQVKVRGQSVILSEVEAALRALPGVAQCVVIARRAPPGDLRVVACVAPESLDPRALRRGLAERLPAHAVPAAFVLLPALPASASGKADTKALPDPDWAHPVVSSPYIAPRSPIEEQLGRIWADALGVARVGVADHFLELGGDSLNAARIVSRANAVFGVELTTSEVLGVFTVEALAALIATRMIEGSPDHELQQLLDELERGGDAA